MSVPVGLVGRFATMKVTRGEEVNDEVCEVMACQAAGEYGYYRILVATQDGTILQVGYEALKLVPIPSSSAGPYR